MEVVPHPFTPEPRIIDGPAMLLFGLSQRYPYKTNAGIPEQWGRFSHHFGHIPNQSGSIAYGVCRDADEPGRYDYICAVEVTSFPAEPAEFTQVPLSPQTYWVVEHTGHISSITGTWKAIWEQGPPAGYKAADAPSFERYDHRFNGHTGLGGLEIWIPVRPA